MGTNHCQNRCLTKHSSKIGEKVKKPSQRARRPGNDDNSSDDNNPSGSKHPCLEEARLELLLSSLPRRQHAKRYACSTWLLLHSLMACRTIPCKETTSICASTFPHWPLPSSANVGANPGTVIPTARTCMRSQVSSTNIHRFSFTSRLLHWLPESKPPACTFLSTH